MVFLPYFLIFGDYFHLSIGYLKRFPLEIGVARWARVRTQTVCETHSGVKRPNAVLFKRQRSAADKSKINSGCMQKHKREKKAALFLQRAF